ncbi:terpene cyclase/mutase family protein [Cytobacillus sp. NCCP-133]|uniref:terpene cyclase/mutase family protein n=1 Tax=Cytobacillus sp. NCCP-133 TaxID=766848 RepID=UPI0022308BCA|nr:prenyltransferase/squalene oxidase repeat-containing protein [Cytobacillus sp. NCCP-133]GLB61603.1 sporulenol synthase [Cytobacillus sp. NCCP-133]
MYNTTQGINQLIHKLKKAQSSDGSWKYPFDTGISTDAYMIILLRTLEIHDEKLMRGLVSRIRNKQEGNGAWKLFYDERGGNATATLEAYYALLYSGYVQKEDPRMIAARRFILENGGMENVNIFTKIMLSSTGQYKWPASFPIPVEVMLLPLSFPFNFYQFSVYGRVNLAPILILAETKFSLKTKYSPDLSELNLTRSGNDDWAIHPDYRSLLSAIKDGIEDLLGLPEQLHSMAMDRAKEYMLERIEPDGTFYSYFSSTFLMIFALLSLGYAKDDQIIIKAVKGLKSLRTDIGSLPHMQYTDASVWNTSLINSTLQLAGVSHKDPFVQKANTYLLKRQQDEFGDWVIHNPNSLPGGWGFSDVNTVNPDVDDTTASLRSIARSAKDTPIYQGAWDRGISWLLSMQNEDGGWPSFERNTQNPWLDFLPIEKGEYIFGDPTSADLTGRTLEFLGSYTDLPKDHSSFQKAFKWLLKNQEQDGSWYGRWGVCYIYGTWASLTGLMAAGLSPGHPAIRKGADFLKRIQNHDGGWGESCLSDSQKTYVPLNASTLTDTSWAVDALLAVEDRPTPAIQKGIHYLLNSIDKEDWTTAYPKGQAMAESFYIHYHSYRYIFPLMALSHYHRKFEQ